LIKDIDFEEYKAAEGVNKSQLDQINISPKHLQHYLKNPPEPTKAMEFGGIIHSAILEPDWFYENLVISPDLNKNTKKYKAWALEHEDCELVLDKKEAEMITGMLNAFASHPKASALLNGKVEQSIFVKDPDTGLLCKGRADILHNEGEAIIDYKSTKLASPYGFSKSIVDFRYHVQAAFYLDMFEWEGMGYDRFVFIAQDKAPPYDVAVYELDFGSIERGRELYRQNLELYKKCVDENIWPGS